MPKQTKDWRSLLELVPPPSPIFGVLVLWSSVLPLRVLVYSKDCGDTPRAPAYHLPIVVIVTSFIDNHPHLGLGPLTHPQPASLTAGLGTIQTGCPAPTTSGESPFNNLQHIMMWFPLFPPIPVHHLPTTL